MNALTLRALRNIPAPKGRETAASLGGRKRGARFYREQLPPPVVKMDRGLSV